MIQETLTKQRAASPGQAPARPHKLGVYYQALVQRIRCKDNGTTAHQAIGITGCGRRAGVSTVAINLAVAAARTGKGPVLFVDATGGKRSIHRAFRIRPVLSLTDAVASDANPLDCVQASRVANLSVVAAGSGECHGVPSLDSASASQALEALKQHFSLIVFDLPKAAELTGCICLAGQLDGVILVFEAERADGRAALRVKKQLADAGAHLLGVVFNKRRMHVPQWLYRLV